MWIARLVVVVWAAFAGGWASPAWAGQADTGDPGDADHQPADEWCLKEIRDDAGRARRLGAFYLAEMTRLENNPRATSGMSTCRTAMRRAETYIARQEEDNAICVVGSSYVDRQISQLFKGGVQTCRAELRSVVQTLPADEQELVQQRVRQREAELQATALPKPADQQ